MWYSAVYPTEIEMTRRTHNQCRFLLVWAFSFACFVPVSGQTKERVVFRAQVPGDFTAEPTTVRIGRPTNEERAYSQEYKKVYSGFAIEPLTNLTDAERSAKIQRGISIGKEKPFFLGDEKPPVAQEFLHTLACGADAIIFGSPVSRAAHLTDDETFVYSQYSFLVNRVFKNNLVSQIKSGSQIQITRPGGDVIVNTQIIRVEDKNIEFLKKAGQYVLFLHYVPKARGYIMAERDGDMLVQGNVANGLSNPELPAYLGRNLSTESYFRDLYLAVGRGCLQH
jgi:hypothetical protein